MPAISGELLRTARQGARLSQADLARRAGIAQRVVSAYESGRRGPSLPTLTRLIEATGHELAIKVVATSERALGLPDTLLGRRLRQRQKAIIGAAEDRRAHNVRVVGSVARGDNVASSDIDPEVLAEEPEIPWGDVAGMRDHLMSHRCGRRRPGVILWFPQHSWS